MTDKILFVDDEPAVLDGCKRMLHREFEVNTAISGEQGLAEIQENGPYAVVVSDMRMPEMNEPSFCRESGRLARNGKDVTDRAFRHECRDGSSK